MNLSITGKITRILDVESGTSKAGKEWRKQSFVVDTGEQYNPEVCFSLFGDDKIVMLESTGVGQEVEVAFNLSSREFNGKFYHNVDAWKITPVAGGGSSAGDDVPVSAKEPPVEEDDGDVPF